VATRKGGGEWLLHDVELATASTPRRSALRPLSYRSSSTCREDCPNHFGIVHVEIHHVPRGRASNAIAVTLTVGIGCPFSLHPATCHAECLYTRDGHPGSMIEQDGIRAVTRRLLFAALASSVDGLGLVRSSTGRVCKAYADSRRPQPDIRRINRDVMIQKAC